MKKTPRPGAICRYVWLYGAISRAVAQEAKNDTTIGKMGKEFQNSLRWQRRKGNDQSSQKSGDEAY